jgi:excisionase family DNA binding protein
MGNFRLAIVFLAGLLLLLSIQPLRRRLPGFRHYPPGLELVLWLAFISLCVAALSGVRTARSTELGLAVARAAFDVAGRSIDSLLGPAIRWVSVHEPGVALITLAAAGVAWVVVGAQAAFALRRALEPRPRLNDWWVVKSRPKERLRIEVHPAPAVAPPALVDVHAAALYLGVSRTTVYRWARGGRLRSRRAGTKLCFSSGDLAALREPDSAESHHA